MSKLTFDISMSLDGYTAGPDPDLKDPLGQGGEQLHEWVVALKSWREEHGMEGGTTGVDDEIQAEAMEGVGAHIMGRNMFGGGEGPWNMEEPWEGWWGDEPPFGKPVFVLTHHPREPLVLGATTFTFVTDGIESALEQARAAAGDGDIAIAGGANVIQQYLAAGLVDHFQIHISPVFLGGGTRLFDGLGDAAPKVEVVRAVESPAVTHLRYRVLR
jgi:dihydrofolate reductase